MDDLESRIGYHFEDPGLREQALTHRSFCHENEGEPALDNERLEFLGDAVLGFQVSRMLFRSHPAWAEGELSRLRSQLVSARNLARKARGLRLGEEIHLGKGEEKSGGREKDSILADAYESLLAAIFLDGGAAAATAFVEREFAEEIAADLAHATLRDFKSQLQEVLHQRGAPEPLYQVVEETGPDHLKVFEVVVLAGSGDEMGRGSGRSKKLAQQEAARSALLQLGIET